MKNFLLIVFVVAIAALGILPSVAVAQDPVKDNGYAKVQVSIISGQFQVSNPRLGNPSLTFPSQYTSHTNFVFAGSGGAKVLTNEIGVNNGSIKMHEGPATVLYISPDSIYTLGDSIFVEWHKQKMGGYLVQQVTYPFRTWNSGQIAVEYRSKKIDLSTSNVLTGILLELDVFAYTDGVTCPVGGNDKAVILDAHGYEAAPNLAPDVKCWHGQCAKYLKIDQGTSNQMPEWFHAAGLFPGYKCASGCALGTGKLWGVSRVTAPIGDLSKSPVVTQPDEFYIGDWGDANNSIGLKCVGWTVGSPDFDASATYSDVALIYKWNVSGDPFRCCTVYGPNDDVNDNLTCNSNSSQAVGMFVDVRFPKRIIHNADGTYTPDIDTIRIWAANTEHSGGPARNMQAHIDTTNTCLLLAEGPNHTAQPLTKNMNVIGTNTNDIGQKASGYCEFYFRVDSSRCCIPGQTTDHEDTVKITVTSSDFPVFYQPCSPTIEVQCYLTVDTVKPVAQTVAQSFPNFAWDVSDNQLWDKGIDSIIVVSAQNMKATIPSWSKCDKTVLRITAYVVDTLQAGCLTYRVVDCAGNSTIVTQCYNPSPDKIAPKITVSETNHKSVGLTACSPNDQYVNLLVDDNAPNVVTGLKVISTSNKVNFKVATGPFTIGAKSDTVGLTVIDSLLCATVTVDVSDVAGNLSSYTVTYCPALDTNPPVANGSLVGKVFSYDITEKKAWDRGICSVIVESNTNCTIFGPTKVDSSHYKLSFTVIDTSKDADFCFVARDSFFCSQSSCQQFGLDSTHHMTRVCGSFSSAIDTMAPNISIVPNPANGGYDALVTVSDTHYLSTGDWYKRDKHLNTITFTGSINVDTSGKPSVKTCVDTVLRFTIRAADSLALIDSVACVNITATDCQSNVSNIANWCYPVKPDINPPTITFSDGATRDYVVFHLKDDTTYDRGLFSVTGSNLVNVAPFDDTIYSGTGRVFQKDFTLHILDTSKAAHADICVTDLWAQFHPSVLAAHQTCFPFDTYVIPVWPAPLGAGQGGMEITNKVNIQMPPVDVHLKSIEFLVVHPRGNGVYVDNILQTPAGVSQISNPDWPPINPLIQKARVRFTAIDPTADIPYSITSLGYLQFHSDQPEQVITANIAYDPASLKFDDYKTWTEVKPHVNIPHLAPFGSVPSDGNLVIGGRCRQVLLTPSSAKLSLEQNIPNPAVTESRITYSLDRSGPIRLTLVDALGNPVKTLVEGEGKPGTYAVIFDVSDLRSGVYYYRLDCYGAVLSRAMSIMR